MDTLLLFVDAWTWLNGLLAAAGLGALKYVLRVQDRSSSAPSGTPAGPLWLELAKPWQPFAVLAIAAVMRGLELSLELGPAGIEGALAAVPVAVGLRETAVRFVKPHVPDEYRVPRG